MAERFRIGWASGPTAQIDLYSPGKDAREYEYQLKYTPSFRSIFRRSAEPQIVSAGELDNVKEAMDRLVKVLGGRAKAAALEEEPGAEAGAELEPPPLALADSETVRAMKRLGETLLDLIIPPYLQTDLRSHGLFLEMGLDEILMPFPWELMFDGDEFLCLKQAMGRFVNGRKVVAAQQRPTDRWGEGLDKLSILLISVPKPAPRADGTVFDALPEAQKETDRIVDTVDKIPGVEVDLLEEPTWSNVAAKLKSRDFQIVHFNGHAHFDAQDQNKSGLVLLDRDMAAPEVRKYFGRRPSVLYFINACETGATEGAVKEGGNRFDTLGLARAFMEADAYSLGSRWKIDDQAACTFAESFYEEFLQGEPIGQAIKSARKRCRGQDEFAWASYVYYGDPRICFVRS